MKKTKPAPKDTRLYFKSRQQKLGKKECTYGPSYWCASLKNAQKCQVNRSSHCKIDWKFDADDIQVLKFFFKWMCSWLFSGRGTLQNKGVESQLIQQWAPVTPYRKRLLFNKTVFCKCNFFKNDVIYLWLLFCLFFILISQSCENMLYDIVCLFYFRNHNFTLNVFCRIPVDFFVGL